MDELRAVHKLCHLRGEGGGGQKFPILLSKKTTERRGEGVKNCVTTLASQSLMQFYLGGKNKNSNIYNFFWDLKNNRDELLSQKSLYLENIDEFAVAEVFSAPSKLVLLLMVILIN